MVAASASSCAWSAAFCAVSSATSASFLALSAMRLFDVDVSAESSEILVLRSLRSLPMISADPP